MTQPDAVPNPFGALPEESRVLAPRWVLNGFPKSGLHYLAGLLRPVASPMPPGQLHEDAWIGTFAGQSWTTQWTSTPLLCYRIARTQHSHYLKGHIGHTLDIEQFMWLAGVAHVFIYRDLRDVAVSQAYHVLSDSDVLMHPNKQAFKALHEKHGMPRVLQAVLEGYGEWPGLFERWSLYAGWLQVPWVYKLRYEDLRNSPARVAGELLRYGVERVAAVIGYVVDDVGPMFDEARTAMALASSDTTVSATFRRGVSGEWREVFTPKTVALFKRLDTANWLTTLGYEQDNDW